MAYTSSPTDKERAPVLERLREMKRRMPYDALVAETGINRKELCNMINLTDYEPPAWVWIKLGVPVYELAPVCPIHGKACVLDCANEKAVPIEARVIVPHGTPRRTPLRFTVYSGTPTDKILLELEKLTGRRFACLDE